MFVDALTSESSTIGCRICVATVATLIIITANTIGIARQPIDGTSTDRPTGGGATSPMQKLQVVVDVGINPYDVTERDVER